MRYPLYLPFNIRLLSVTICLSHDCQRLTLTQVRMGAVLVPGLARPIFPNVFFVELNGSCSFHVPRRPPHVQSTINICTFPYFLFAVTRDHCPNRLLNYIQIHCGVFVRVMHICTSCRHYREPYRLLARIFIFSIFRVSKIY